MVLVRPRNNSGSSRLLNLGAGNGNGARRPNELSPPGLVTLRGVRAPFVFGEGRKLSSVDLRLTPVVCVFTLSGVLRAGVRADPNAAGSGVGSKLERGRGRELMLTGVRRRTALPRFGRPGVECLAGVDRNTRSSSTSPSRRNGLFKTCWILHQNYDPSLTTTSGRTCQHLGNIYAIACAVNGGKGTPRRC